MSSAALKWVERSKSFCQLEKPTLIGFKFKRLKDYISTRSSYPEMKDPRMNIENLKLHTITMKDGFCFFCSNGTYQDKEVDRIETFAYTAFEKNSSNKYIPNLFNLS